MSQSEKNQTKKWYEPILDWLKLYGERLLDWVLNNGGYFIASKLTGWKGTAAKYIYDWVVNPLAKYWRAYFKNVREAKEKADNFKEEISKEQTDEERKKSESDFLGD